ncbi:MAG: AAA family ATPase [Actinomycetaceae bacterium]|nr:AAA family ATPase [Actinomycetaceae bacterium]
MREYRGTLEGLVQDLATEIIETSQNSTPLRTVGFTGPPGVGKSTASKLLADLLSRESLPNGMPLLAGRLPLDGFHKSNRVLEYEELSDSKGMPRSFDVVGFLMTLDRIRTTGLVVYAPDYDRTLHEPIAARHRIEPQGVVITEGNYLALQDGPWLMLREQIDLLIYLSVPQDELLSRLVARKVAHGSNEEDANEWVRTVDSANITTVEGTRSRCDRVWKF